MASWRSCAAGRTNISSRVNTPSNIVPRNACARRLASRLDQRSAAARGWRDPPCSGDAVHRRQRWIGLNCDREPTSASGCSIDGAAPIPDLITRGRIGYPLASRARKTQSLVFPQPRAGRPVVLAAGERPLSLGFSSVKRPCSPSDARDAPKVAARRPEGRLGNNQAVAAGRIRVLDPSALLVNLTCSLQAISRGSAVWKNWQRK